MSEDPRPDAARIADALADLFDTVPPADRAAADDELRATGRDPSIVGRRFQQLAEGAMARPSASRPIRTRPVVPTPRAARRLPVLLPIAALLLVGIAIGWLGRASRLRPDATGTGPAAGGLASQRRIAPSHEQPVSNPGTVASRQDPAATPKVGTSAAPGAHDAARPPVGADADVVVTAAGGRRLDSSNWQEARAQLPAPVLDRVKSGEYVFSIVDLDQSLFAHIESPVWLHASTGNANRYVVDPENCGLLDSETGKAPDFYFGNPFPAIMFGQPNDGCRIMWNVEAAAARAGGRTESADVVGFGDEAPRAVELRRSALSFVSRHFGPTHNPQQLRASSMTQVRSGDLLGTTWLMLRPLDGGTPDKTWEYVPSTRRVRRVSEVDRVTPRLGLPFSLDDEDCFAGRLESFTWKVNTVQTALAPVAASAPLVQRYLDSMRSAIDVPRQMAAFQTMSEVLAPWLIVEGLPLTPRPVWVVEGTPRDPSSPTRRIVLYIDRALYRPYWKLTYARDGTLRSHALCGQYWSRDADDDFVVAGTNPMSVASEDGQAALIRQKSMTLDQQLDDSSFTLQTLTTY